MWTGVDVHKHTQLVHVAAGESVCAREPQPHAEHISAKSILFYALQFTNSLNPVILIILGGRKMLSSLER